MNRAESPRALPQTPRLRLRRLQAGDEVRLDALDRDEGVLAFVDWYPPTLDQQRRLVQRQLRDHERWSDHGRFWATDLDGDDVGWFALRVHGESPARLMLSFRLHPRHWGRGLATEGTRTLVEHAFETLDAAVVLAETMAANTGSRRVLEKAGLEYVRTFRVHTDDPLPGSDLGEALYRITREDWDRRPPSRW